MANIKHVALVLGVCSIGSYASAWDAFVIRNANGTNNAPVINESLTQTNIVTNEGGMKVGLGTSDLDGHKLSDLLSASIERLDDYARYASNSGAYYAPYINVWITDGTHFAVIANEPSNTLEWGLNRWNFTWDVLKEKTLKVNEVTDRTWLPNGGSGLKFKDIADFIVQAPTAAQLTAGWAGLGTGAPRELGTNQAYGFNWVFGDTAANYVSGDSGYVVANPKISVLGEATVPGPAAALAFGIGLLGATRRRKASK